MATCGPPTAVPGRPAGIHGRHVSDMKPVMNRGGPSPVAGQVRQVLRRDDDYVEEGDDGVFRIARKTARDRASRSI